MCDLPCTANHVVGEGVGVGDGAKAGRGVGELSCRNQVFGLTLSVQVLFSCKIELL